jgi:hypothetical protein
VVHAAFGDHRGMDLALALAPQVPAAELATVQAEVAALDGRLSEAFAAAANRAVAQSKNDQSIPEPLGEPLLSSLG